MGRPEHIRLKNYLEANTSEERMEIIKDTFDYIDELERQFSMRIVIRQSEQLPACLPKVNRVEVIDQKGRSYVNWKPTNKTEISLQDDEKTLKVFISG